MRGNGSQMAVGDEAQRDYVVVVLANGGVELVRGPMNYRETLAEAAKLMADNYNALAKQVVVRPLQNQCVMY